MKSSLFSTIFKVFLGALLGFLAAHFLNKPIGNSNIFFRKPSNDTEPQLLSSNFRKAAGYCGNTSATNHFELTYAMITDLKNAADQIEKELTTKPAKYRFIYGKTDANAPVTNDATFRIIVVGVDRSNNEITSNIKITDGGLPCPIYCDRSSQIVWRNGKDCIQ